MIDKHRVVLEESKSEYDKVKKSVDKLRATEVLLLWVFLSQFHATLLFAISQTVGHSRLMLILNYKI